MLVDTDRNVIAKAYQLSKGNPIEDSMEILAKLVDFAISILLIVAVMIYYGVNPGWNLVYLPLFVVMMIAVPLGITSHPGRNFNVAGLGVCSV